MRTQDENLKALSRAALDEARTEAEQILADAQAKADHIRQQAQAHSETERERILQQAQKESDRTRSEAIAGAELEARMLKLARREELLSRVFDAVRGKLEAVTQWTDYDQIVRELVLEATRQVGSQEVRIRGDERARAALTDEVLGNLSKETSVEVQLEDTLKGATGIIAESADGHRRYDNTLEARLTRAQDALRTPVYHMLMGKSS